MWLRKCRCHWSSTTSRDFSPYRGFHHHPAFAEDGDLGVEVDTLCTTKEFAHALRRCGSSKDLATGRLIHARITEISVEWKTVPVEIENLLVEMYGKCGDTPSARRVFDRLPERNGFSWNIMIAAYTPNGHYRDALGVFRMMICEGLRPDKVTCISVLDAFGSLGVLRDGKAFHQSVVAESGFETDVIVGTAVLTMYNRCGSVAEAKEMFHKLPAKNVVTWSAMIAAYAQLGHPSQALELLPLMEQEGVKPNAITLVSVLDACASLGESKRKLGQLLHARAVSGGFHSDVILCNALVHMYGKCGQVDEAREVFQKMEVKNSVTWNTMMAAFSRHELYREAFMLLGKMDVEGVRSNKVTYVTVIDACTGMGALCEGQLVHESVSAAGLEADYAVGNALVNLYGRCGKLRAARIVLEGIPARDKITWTTLLVAYVQHGRGLKALKLVMRRMDQEGIRLDSFTFVNLLECCISIVTSAAADRKEQASSLALSIGEQLHDRMTDSGVQPDTALQTALVDMYGKCGNPEAAKRVFDRMTSVKNVTVWNALLAAYSLRDQGKEALEVFRRMNLEGLRPDKVTFLGAFEACSSLAALSQGRLLHARMVESGLDSDTLLTTAVINMFAKCGSLEDSKRVFESKVYQGGVNNHDVVTWSAMVAAHSQFGRSGEALGYFYRMQQEGIRPDSITFISVISACSHSGLVEEASHWFTALPRDYGIKPTEAHFGCFVDLLSRAGWLREAEKLMRRMPYRPYYSTWMTLLSACRTYGDLKRARRLAVKLSFLRPLAGGPYGLLANLFCLDRKWDDVQSVKQSLVDRGLVKQPGCSWIEVRGRVYEFYGGDDESDMELPREEDVLAELRKIRVEIRNVGYERDPIKRVHDDGEQEKKFMLSYHSEKLAVVFGIVSTPTGSPIRVVKNIKTCHDCHSIIKCISKLYGREISLRDSWGFHRFINGTCSCNN